MIALFASFDRLFTELFSIDSFLDACEMVGWLGVSFGIPCIARGFCVPMNGSPYLLWISCEVPCNFGRASWIDSLWELEHEIVCLEGLISLFAKTVPLPNWVFFGRDLGPNWPITLDDWESSKWRIYFELLLLYSWPSHKLWACCWIGRVFVPSVLLGREAISLVVRLVGSFQLCVDYRDSSWNND